MLTRINGNLVSNPWILTQVAKALLLADILCCRRIFQIFVCSTSWTLLPSTCYGQHLLSNPSTVLHSTAIPRSGNCHADFSSVQNATNYLTPTSYGIVLRINSNTYFSKLGEMTWSKKAFALIEGFLSTIAKFCDKQTLWILKTLLRQRSRVYKSRKTKQFNSSYFTLSC